MGLLAAVADAPDDDAPRLLYAQALLDEGNPLGELIQLQCELEVCRRLGRRRELCERADELRRAHESDWTRPVLRFTAVTRGTTWSPLPAVQAVGFRRGFIESLRLPFLDYARHAAALVEAAPLLRKLELETVPDDAEVALAWPRHLRELGAHADPAWFTRLFATPAGRGLRALRLYLGPAHVDWLVACDWLLELESLHIIADGATTRLLASRLPSLPKLRALEFQCTRCPDSHLPAALLGDLLVRTPDLTSLVLRDLYVGDAGARVIASAGRHLEKLGLVGPVGIGPQGCAALRESEALRDMWTLWLHVELSAPELASLRATFPEAEVSIGGTVFGIDELRAIGDWFAPAAFQRIPLGARASRGGAPRALIEGVRTARQGLERVVSGGLLDDHWLVGDSFLARRTTACVSCGGTGRDQGWERGPCYAADCDGGRVWRYARADAPGSLDDLLTIAGDAEGLRRVVALARALGRALGRWSGRPREPALALRVGPGDLTPPPELEIVIAALRRTRVLAGQQSLTVQDPDWLPRARAMFLLAVERGATVLGDSAVSGLPFSQVPNPFDAFVEARRLGYQLGEGAPGEILVAIDGPCRSMGEDGDSQRAARSNEVPPQSHMPIPETRMADFMAKLMRPRGDAPRAAAEERLLLEYGPVLFRFLFNKTRRVEDHFADIHKQCKAKFRGDAQGFRVALITAAKQRLASAARDDELGRQNERHAPYFPPEPTGPWPDGILLCALRAIGGPRQMMLELHHFEAMAASEIAVIFGVSEGAVTSELEKALEALRLSIEASSVAGSLQELFACRADPIGCLQTVASSMRWPPP